MAIYNKNPPAVDASAAPELSGVVHHVNPPTELVSNRIDTTYLDRTTEIINNPGGNNNQIQYAYGGQFKGDNGFVFDPNTKSVYLRGNLNLGGYLKGKIYTNPFNFHLTGGVADSVLTTDGTGNLSWGNVQTILNYGNANVASYLASYSGNSTANNSQINNLSITNSLSINGGGTLSLDVSQLQLAGGTNGQYLKTYGNGTVAWSTDIDLEQTNVTLTGSTISLDSAGNSGVWGGSIPNANVIGGFVNNDGSNNALMTFSTNGSNVMSINVDGSIFAGGAFDTLDNLDSASSGWVVAGNGLALTNNGSRIKFHDGTTQYTAYPGVDAVISESDPGLGDGRVWFNSVEGRAFIKYSGQWVDMNPQIAPNPDLNANSITFEDGSVLTTGNIQGSSYSNSNVASYLPTYTGNISANNVLLSSTLVTSSIQGNTGLVINSTDTMNMLVNNVSGIEVTGGSVGIYAQNILSLQFDGANADFRNQHVNNVNSLNVNGNITGNYIIGNGSQLTDIITSNLTNTTQTFVLNNDGSFGVKDSGSATNFNLDQTTPNIDLRTSHGTGFFTSASTITFRTNGVKNWIFDGSGNLSTQGSINLGATHGNIVVGDATPTGSPGLSASSSLTLTANREGTSTWMVFGADGNLSLPGNLSYVGSDSANIIGFNSANFAGNLSASNIYTNNYYLANGDPLPLVSGSSNVTTTGNVTAGNVIAGNFSGNGSQLTHISGANVVGTVANANYAVYSGTAYSVSGSNVSGTVALASHATVADSANSVSGSNVSGPVAFATVANSVAAANVSGLGNVSLINKDGNASNVLYGNGVFAAPAPSSSYSNSNVTTLLSSFGSNTLVTTGNVTAGYFIGNGSQLTGLPASYANSNVATYLPTYTGTLPNVGSITANGAITSNNTITGANIIANGNVTVNTLLLYGSNATLSTTNGSSVQFAGRVNFNNTGTSFVASGNANVNGSLIVGSSVSLSGNLTLTNSGYITTTSGTNGNVNIDPDGTGNVNVTGNVIISGSVTGGGIRQTTATSAPSSPTVGDQWYNSSTDVLYQYVNDGVSSYWLDIAGPGYSNPQTITKVSNFVNAGTFVTLDNIKATVTTSGNRGLSLSGVSSSFTATIGATYAVSGGTGGSSTNGTTSITTTPSTAAFGWNFTGNGDISTYIVTDTTNNRAYRITLQIGGGYNNNMITIERLI